MIGIIDYGAGNLASVRKAFTAIGCEATTCTDAGRVDDFAALVVPGVGHFGATAAIHEALRARIASRVEAGVPLLGICLGMQWLFESSAEAAGVQGLAVFRGRCTRIEADAPLKVPHVGWNALRITRAESLMNGVSDGEQVYFTHSFAVAASDEAIASSVHGSPFVAAVQRDHICGVQFHPEKSGDVGLRVLRNFVRIAKG